MPQIASGIRGGGDVDVEQGSCHFVTVSLEIVIGTDHPSSLSNLFRVQSPIDF